MDSPLNPERESTINQPPKPTMSCTVLEKLFHFSFLIQDFLKCISFLKITKIKLFISDFYL